MFDKFAQSAQCFGSGISRYRVTGRAVLLLVLTASPIAARADDEAHQVTTAIREFYDQLAAGNHKAAFGKLMVGARGYLPTGLLREIPDQQTLERTVRAYDEGYKQGGRIVWVPKYMQVTVHGNVTLATLLTEGMIKRPGDTRAVETPAGLARLDEAERHLEGSPVSHFQSKGRRLMTTTPHVLPRMYEWE